MQLLQILHTYLRQMVPVLHLNWEDFQILTHWFLIPHVHCTMSTLRYVKVCWEIQKISTFVSSLCKSLDRGHLCKYFWPGKDVETILSNKFCYQLDFLIRWIYVKKKICVPKSMFHGGAARHYHVNWIFNHERDGYYTSAKNTGMLTTQSCVQVELKSYFHLSEKAQIQPARFFCCWPHFWNIGQNTDIDFWL